MQVSESSSITYFQIFPNAKIEIKTNINNKNNSIIYPHMIGDAIKHTFGIPSKCKWINLEHSCLIENIFYLIFEGLDLSRFNLYKSEMPTFQSLNQNGFPVFVEALEKDGNIISGYNTSIGHIPRNIIFKSYLNINSMKLNTFQLVDNGYPIILSNDSNIQTTNLRCEIYNLKFLTTEELNDFKMLPQEKTELTKDFLAIDCEMIETTLGSELVRLSAVDFDNNIIINEYYKPLGEVINYRTEFSGINKEKLNDITITNDQSYFTLSKYASKDTIIAGHSLENDLRSLKLIHLNCIDTALLYTNDPRTKFKFSLQNIYQKYIQKPFRININEGHDSIEDAKAVVDLIKFALNQKVTAVFENPKIPNLFNEILKFDSKIQIFTKNNNDLSYDGLNSKLLINTFIDDQDTLNNFLKIEKFNSFLNIISFKGLFECQINEEEEKKECLNYENYLKLILEKIPNKSVIFIYGPNGNFNRLKSDSKTPPGYDKNKIYEFSLCRNGLIWIKCKN